MFNNNSEQELRKKLILLYAAQQFAVPLTNRQMTDFIMQQELLNYFEMQQYLGDLVDQSMLEFSTSEGEDYYVITETGNKSLELLGSRIPQFERRQINDAIAENKKSFVMYTNIFADYTKEDDDEYVVSLKVQEGPYTMIDLKLNVVSNKHAKAICENWEQNAQYLYGDILSILQKNPDPTDNNDA